MATELVIDADGHTMEADDLWVERMDHDKWGDWIPRKVTEDDVYETTYVGGQIRSGGRELRDNMAKAVGMTPKQLYDLMESIRVPGGYDPHARLSDMDRDGIDAAVLYPSLAMFFGPLDEVEALRNHEFVADCQRAYNEWVADYCSADPKRLFGVAAVPLQAPELAVAEAERAVNELGHRAIFIRPSAYLFADDGTELPLNHSAYDRFWAACQDLDVPVALHPGVHVDTPGACRKYGLVAVTENIMLSNSARDELHGGSALGQAVGNTVDMIVSMGRLLMGGVCERFPKLRFLFLESGGGWIPTQLERMDEQVKAFPLEKRWLSMLPSEYFKRQCYAGFEAEEWNIAACAEFLGPERILWASDYPHPEFHPEVVKELRERIGGLSDDDQRKILGGNAIEAYRLPL
jgi:predicted TIM-barrel fold metal-dependent hydrolase